MNDENSKDIVGKITEELGNKNFIHLNKDERIKLMFNLYHGKGKRKKKKKR